jgi:mitochondrial fission protein ELM1
LAKAKAHGGSVVVIGSPRTPRRLLLKAQERVRSVQVPATLVPVGGSPPYAELLEWADTISVTADSVAMVSDAISTGKPVEHPDDTMRLAARLKADLGKMLEEHKAIGAATDRLLAAANAEKKTAAAAFAVSLRHHARMEEDVMYPAAILAGDYLRISSRR